MCDPTGGILTTGLLLLGTGTQAYAAHQEGKYTARMEESNAKLAQTIAADSTRRGAVEEDEHRAKVRAMLGMQRAAFGAANVVSNTGTPLGLLTETAETGELDALKIRNNAAREAWGYGKEAEQARSRGKMARRAGNTNALGTVLGGGAQAYGYWNNRPKKAA